MATEQHSFRSLSISSLLSWDREKMVLLGPSRICNCFIMVFCYKNSSSPLPVFHKNWTVHPNHSILQAEVASLLINCLLIHFFDRDASGMEDTWACLAIHQWVLLVRLRALVAYGDGLWKLFLHVLPLLRSRVWWALDHSCLLQLIVVPLNLVDFWSGRKASRFVEWSETEVAFEKLSFVSRLFVSTLVAVVAAMQGTEKEVLAFR